MKTVKFNAADLPPLSKEDQAQIRTLAKRPDEDIDLGDLPELTKTQLSAMERSKFYRPIKQQITARLDTDVLQWLKSKGKGYQTRMNAILRQAMLSDR